MTKTIHYNCRGCGVHVRRRVERGIWSRCPHCGTINPGPEAQGVLNVRPAEPVKVRVAARPAPPEERSADQWETFEL